MKKVYLVFFCILLLTYGGIAQSINLIENDELLKVKQERMNQPVNHSDKLKSDGYKSINDDFGNPPNWDWVTTFGGSGKDIAREVVSSADGSLFVTGSFSGNISIGANSYTSVGRRDAFIAKFHSDGNLAWFNQFSPFEHEKIDANGIHLDELGNIYFTGYYTGDVSFGDFALPDIHDMNMFLAVANADGEITMATVHSTSNPLELGMKVNVDGDGNIFVVGSTSGSTDFRYPSVIVKYAPDGTVIMDYYQSQNFYDIEIVNDNVYFVGTIITADYIGDFFMESMGYHDAFIAKANSNMEFLWVQMGNHTGSFTGDSYAIGLHVSSDEEVFLLGSFRNEVIWGEIVINGYGGFLAKCSTNGDFLWAKQIYETEQDSPTVIDGNDASVFVGTGYYHHSTVFAFSALDGLVVDEVILESLVESISCCLDDNSLLISQSADELIQLSKLDANTLNTDWSVLFGGNSGWAYGIGLDVDQFGYVFSFGYVSNQIDYFGQTISKGLFLSRQNTTGNPLWVVQFPDSDKVSEYIGNYIVADTNTNNVYITGEFNSTFNIPGGPTLIPADNGSIFLLKYDFAGNFQWAIQEDFTSYMLSLAYDNQGNIFLTGLFSNTVTIGNTELVSAGYDDVFIAKYDSDGQVVWAKRAGGENMEYMGLISIDAMNNLYLTGEFPSHDVTVDDFAIIMEEGDGNILFAKLDPLGNVLWASAKGGSSVSSSADYYGWPTAIYTDAEGNSYIKGWCNDSSHFDNILLASAFSNPDYNNRWNKFTTKFDTDGNTIWATSISELRAHSFDYNQFDVDENGNVYTCFYKVNDTTLFGDDFMYVNIGTSDLLIVNYSNDGDLNWVKSIEDSESGSTRIVSIATIDSETAYVCGWFNDYLDFGDMDFEVNNKTGFIGLLGELTGIDVYNRNDEDLLFDLFPIPAHEKVRILFAEVFTDEVNLVITDIAGRNIYSTQLGSQPSETTINISDLSSGVYFVKLKSGNKVGIKKLVVR